MLLRNVFPLYKVSIIGITDDNEEAVFRKLAMVRALLSMFRLTLELSILENFAIIEIFAISLYTDSRLSLGTSASSFLHDVRIRPRYSKARNNSYWCMSI